MRIPLMTALQVLLIQFSIYSVCGDVTTAGIDLGNTTPFTNPGPIDESTIAPGGMDPDRPAIEVRNTSDKVPLYIAGLYSLYGDLDGSGVYVASDLALKHVNEKEDVLRGYELRMEPSNSQCTNGVAIQNLFKQIFEAPQKLLVVGPACSTSAQAIASTAYFWNLNVLSPTASSPSLSNRKRYPSFFRIIPSETLLNPPYVRIMRYFNWTRVATIHQNHELFALSIDDLLTRLRNSNITVISSESFDEDPKNQVENLKKQDAKIIVASMYNWHIKRVLCEAFRLDLYGEGYMWFIPGWYQTGWYLEEDSRVDCSIEELAHVVESSMYIASQQQFLGKEDTVTVAGITPAEYEIQLARHIRSKKEFQNYTIIPHASYGYDSIWAVALALNHSAEVLKSADGQRQSLDQFTYDDKNMSNIIFDALGSVDFEGVSGRVSFSGSDRIGVMNIEQLQAQCPDGWTVEGRNCYLFSPSELIWDDAVSSCRNHSGSLLTILSEKEGLALPEVRRKQGMRDVNKWWISLRTDPSGELVWSGSTSETPSLAQWLPHDLVADPVLHAIDGDPCYILDFGLSRWSSVPCDSKHSFICKKDAEFQEITVAEHNIPTDEIEWFREIVFPGGEVPLDHTPQVIFTTVEIYEGIPLAIYTVSCFLAGLGILLAIACLVFNIAFKNQRFIKLSSPNLNSLIILGCIMIYASTCLIGWEDLNIDEVIILKFCQVRVWLFSVGFVLSFGSMFSKTWRVHKVAALKNPKRVIITDRHLFVMVGMLLLVDIILLSAWFILNPMRVEKSYLYSEEDEENHVILKPYILYCTTGNSLIWQGCLYGYKGLLLIFGVFLAWETRKVTIPALNDSKLIGMCVYNVVLLSAVGVGVNLALTNDPSASFIFSSSIQIFCTSVTLIILFIPKMISVKKYPEGRPVTTMKSESNFEMSSNSTDMKNEIVRRRADLKQSHDQQDRCEHTGCGLWLGRYMFTCGDTSVAESQHRCVPVKSVETVSTAADVTAQQA